MNSSTPAPPTIPKYDPTFIEESFACPSCKYDLKGLHVGMRCPECGWKITRTGTVKRKAHTDIGDAPLKYVLTTSLSFLVYSTTGLFTMLQPFIGQYFSDLLPNGVWVSFMFLVALAYALAAYALTTHKRQPKAAKQPTDPQEKRTLRLTARVAAVAFPVGVIAASLGTQINSPPLIAIAIACFMVMLLGNIPLNIWLAELADWTPTDKIAGQYRGCSFVLGTSSSIMLIAALFNDPFGIFRSLEVTAIFALSSGFFIAIAGLVFTIATCWSYILSLLMVTELSWARINARQRDSRDQRIEARKAQQFQDKQAPPSYEEFTSTPPPPHHHQPDQQSQSHPIQPETDPNPNFTPSNLDQTTPPTEQGNQLKTNPHAPNTDAPIPLEDGPVQGAPSKPLNRSEHPEQPAFPITPNQSNPKPAPKRPDLPPA